MAALTRIAMRQRVFTRSKFHNHPPAAELDELWLRGAAGGFDDELARPAGPLLHPFVWFDGQTARAIVPPEAQPNYLPVRAVAITEALAVVVVEREGSIGAGMDAEGGRFGHRLCRVLPHGIERDDGTGPDVERHRG